MDTSYLINRYIVKIYITFQLLFNHDVHRLHHLKCLIVSVLSNPAGAHNVSGIGVCGLVMGQRKKCIY